MKSYSSKSKEIVVEIISVLLILLFVYSSLRSEEKSSEHD